MNRKLILICTISTSLLFMGGCNSSSPNELIEAPKILESQRKTEDTNSIVKQFLPVKAKLLDASKIASGKAVIKVDVDNDKKDEIIGFFDVPESVENGFVVIKEKEGKWNKIYEHKGEGSKILNSEIIDMYGNGKKTLLLGNLISNNAGAMYNLFTFNNDGINKVDLGKWHKMEVVNTSLNNDKKGFIFAGWISWIHDKAPRVKLFRYDGEKFTYAKDLYPQYFKNIVKYYKDIMDKNSQSTSHWYYLADAQMKVGEYNDALNSIKKGNDIYKHKNETPYYPDLCVLEAQVLNGLKKYDDAKRISEELAAKLLKRMETNKEWKDEKDDLRYIVDEWYLRYVYLELSKSCYKLKQEDEGLQYYNKYVDVTKVLQKKDAFKHEFLGDYIEPLYEVK